MIESFIQLVTTDFVWYALIAGVSLALVAGPLGSFIVWRRMSYFGDTLAHSALLGIAIGLITNSNPQLSIIFSSLIFAIILSVLDRKPLISTDTLLGILAHSTLAIGIVVLALSGTIRVNLEADLFGALLTISSVDLVWVVAVVSVVAVILYLFWNDLLSITVHAELAEIEGKNVSRLNLIMVLLIALTIAVSMKIVGVLFACLYVPFTSLPPLGSARNEDSMQPSARTSETIL